MKNLSLVLFLILSSLVTKAQTNWLITKLDDKIAVKFPDNPEKKIGKGNITYMLKTKDSVKYGGVVVDLKVTANLDSANLERMKDSQAFANQLRLGMASQKNDYTFGDITIGNWKTFTSYSLLGNKIVDKGKLSMLMILIGSRLYSFSFLVPDGLKTSDNERFFNSIELLKP